MDVPMLQPMSFLVEAAVAHVDLLNIIRIYQGGVLQLLTSVLQVDSAYSRLLVQCIVVAKFAIAGENVFAVWQALKELYRVAHGDSSLPESVWHTWQCTFKIGTACDLAQIPSNLMFDCGLGGTALGLPTNDALLDVEQLACAQQAYFAQVGMTHVLSCKPQSCQVLLEALASIQRLQEKTIPILASDPLDPSLAHGIVTACLQGMSLGFTFLWGRDFRCIICLPKYKYIMLVDPYGRDRFPNDLLQHDHDV